MNIETYSLNHIHKQTEFSFSPEEYSEFKFGADCIGQKFGEALAVGFLNSTLAREITNQQIVVISSPYSFVPTATFSMKNYFVYTLNRWLVDHDFPVVEETKVMRNVTYRDDYGALDANQRMQLIGNDDFHIDAEFVKGKHLIFLDDIRITGSHERMILKTAKEYKLENKISLLYFAELKNLEIHPKIENVLNHAKVKNLNDVSELIENKRFVFNTRVVKFILNQTNADFNAFANERTNSFLESLYDLSIGNKYHLIKEYQHNFLELKNKITFTIHN